MKMCLDRPTRVSFPSSPGKTLRALSILTSLTCLASCVGAAPQTEPSSSTGTATASDGGEGEHQYTNGLINSTSPYLLQHAHNPVNWMPWGPEAFAKAKAENKPIFVSIGYSTCYWCHVMERESFEDTEVAAILNRDYIAIKVDREERPDIDEQLMLATQLMTGRGGWPNSIWLTPDGRPWMAGTYFPKANFMSALTQLVDVWKTEAEGVDKQANALADAIRQASQVDAPAILPASSDPHQKLLAEVAQLFDTAHGGIGTQPKFPPHGILRHLILAAEKGNPQAREMMTKTLDAMWCGGVHDHVGGGFHRYSTDERWFLPHFEKMLYDNAQLMRVYAEAHAVTEKPHYRAAVEDIYTWLQREMTHPEGAFYSAIDSESEGGEEGRYYTWSAKELKTVLDSESSQRFIRAYGFSEQGNFVEEATGHRPGTNIPFVILDKISVTLDPQLKELRTLLLEARKQREYPHLDDKILTSWNGLMISSLARAGDLMDEPKYIAAAVKAAEFIDKELYLEGVLKRSWRNGRANFDGYLNDYAFFIEGLLELHAATGEAKWLEHALALSNQMVDSFEDTVDGGFFFTTDQHEKLLLRTKNLTGGGNLPVGNGVATQNLLTIYQRTQHKPALEVAKRALASFSGLMQRAPRQVEHLVLAQVQFDLLQAELQNEE